MALTKIQPFGINSSSTFTFGNVSATGNVTGTYILGNGSQLTGLPEGYANADVAAYLPTYTGNLASLTGAVVTTANVSGNYFIGNGSQLTGLPEGYTNANVAAYLPTYTGNLASLAGNVTTTGNISGNYFIGNGSALNSITGANVTGTVASATTAATVTTAAQPNITSVGTLSSVSVSGNVTGGNLTTAGLTSTGTLQTSGNTTVGGNLIVNGRSILNPTVILQNTSNTSLVSSFNQAFTVRANNGNGSSVMGIMNEVANAYTALTFFNNSGVEMGAVAFGNPNSVYFANSTYLYSAGSNGLILSANVGSAPGNKNLWITNAGLVTIPGSTAASNTTTGAFQVTGGVGVGGNVYANAFYGNATGLTSIPGANVTGTVANATSAGSATTAGTVTTAAQPNITSVGTLSSVSVSGNVTGGNLTTAGLTSTGTLQTSGNAIVGGNLVVNGNTVYINITELNVQDPIIGLGRGANNAPLTTNDGKDRGTEMWYYDTAERAAFVGFDNSTGKLIAAANVSIADEIVTVNNYGTFVAGAVESTTVSASGNITGAYILGNGSQLTGLPESYTNANVEAYLPTYTGNLASLTGNVTTTANISGSYILGNGSQLTGISRITWTTQANAAPSSPAPGDFWYDAYTGVKYQYINDGTSNVWVDQSYPTSFSTLAVSGNASIGGHLVVAGNATADFFVGTATQAQYADLAEIYQPDQAYEPGTVLVFGGEHEVTVSTVSHDTRVAGVVSTAPAYLMNSQQSGIPVALTGRVPCRVRGPVAKGEQLVNIEPGIAGAVDFAQYRPGCVIGKSLENIEDSSVHTIEIAVGRY